MGVEVPEKKFCPISTPCVPVARASRKLGVSTDALHELARKGVITFHRTPSGHNELSTGDMAKALEFMATRHAAP